jgi:N utilization substance protein A
MRKAKKDNAETNNRELIEALDVLEKEKGIKKDVILDAIVESLVKACKTQLGNDNVNVEVNLNRETGAFKVYTVRTVVEVVEDPTTQISLAIARSVNPVIELGDPFKESVDSMNLSRIATGHAKNVILQKIREEERKSLFDAYYLKEHDVMTGTVQRYVGRNVSIDLGKCDALLPESEMVKGEHFELNQRVKVYVLEVKETPKGPKISVSRTHPDLVKRLFENEVTEIHDGIVEIKAIYREAGSRTKMAVWSNDPQIDPVGACVGVNGARVNAVVDVINGEKIDIIRWDENPAILIENALSPAKVIGVWADEEDHTAIVIVPDFQLSLAIGREGQNARLAAKLTGYKIDIKSESQARESGLYEELGITDEEYVGYYEEYDEDADAEEEYETDEVEDEDSEAAEETDNV